MPTLQSILAEVQALETTQEESLQAAIAQCVTDIQSFISASAPVADPVVTIVTTTQSGVAETFVPQGAATAATA